MPLVSGEEPDPSQPDNSMSINPDSELPVLSVSIHLDSQPPVQSVSINPDSQMPVIQEEEELMEGLEDDEGYDSLIEERRMPNIPQPDPTVVRLPDSDGWRMIARLGPSSSFLTSFPVLQDVPEQHHQTWVAALTEVLRRWRAATTDEEVTLALSWLLFLPQGLLRCPSRGGRVGRKEVARRFNSITRGDWGFLVEVWEKDKANPFARVGEEEQEESKKRDK